jgi:D-glycero-beta-D-manno-heptose 1-phosphate adenylyltransferase
MKDTKKKIILDYEKLAEIIQAHRILGHRVVCTIGSWDMLHIGHMRYLNRATEEGDILLVGVDSDRGIKLYKKSDLRPIIPEDERMEMLAYQDCVNYVTLIDDVDEKGAWLYGLLKTVKPDVFVAVTDSYPPAQIRDIKKMVKDVIQLPRQADKTSSTNIIEKTVKSHLEKMLHQLKQR